MFVKPLCVFLTGAVFGMTLTYSYLWIFFLLQLLAFLLLIWVKGGYKNLILLLLNLSGLCSSLFVFDEEPNILITCIPLAQFLLLWETGLKDSTKKKTSENSNADERKSK